MHRVSTTLPKREDKKGTERAIVADSPTLRKTADSSPKVVVIHPSGSFSEGHAQVFLLGMKKKQQGQVTFAELGKRKK